MSTLVGVLAAVFLFGAGIGAGWKAAGAHDVVDRLLVRAARDDSVDDEAERGESL